MSRDFDEYVNFTHKLYMLVMWPAVLSSEQTLTVGLPGEADGGNFWMHGEVAALRGFIAWHVNGITEHSRQPVRDGEPHTTQMEYL
jgi:hypothetical protein